MYPALEGQQDTFKDQPLLREHYHKIDPAPVSPKKQPRIVRQASTHKSERHASVQKSRMSSEKKVKSTVMKPTSELKNKGQVAIEDNKNLPNVTSFYYDKSGRGSSNLGGNRMLSQRTLDSPPKKILLRSESKAETSALKRGISRNRQ